MFKCHQIPQARIFGLTALVFVVVLTSGCGFRPLYGTRPNESTATENYLAQIQITQIPDRLGQQLRNNLLSRLTPKGEPRNPRYQLNVSLSESIANLGVKKTSVVTRGNLTVNANYTLNILGDQKHFTSGTVQAISSYDIPQAEFSARAALNDARARAIREIADDIKIRLGVYFKQVTD